MYQTDLRFKPRKANDYRSLIVNIEKQIDRTYDVIERERLCQTKEHYVREMNKLIVPEQPVIIEIPKKKVAQTDTKPKKVEVKKTGKKPKATKK